MATKKLKLKDVRGDVRIGAVPGAQAIHALKDEPENGRNVPMCSTRTKNPIQLWGPAMEQRPELELCAACSKMVPTGEVVVAEKPVEIPGLDLTVTQTVITPDATSEVSAELMAEDDHMRPRWERCALDSVEAFAADARRILLDASELRSATLDAANWTELYEWFTREENMSKNTEATPADAVDVDELISAVHATVDQIKAIEPGSEGAHSKATELKQEAEEKIRQLPTNKRTTLRAAVSDAFKAATDLPAPSTEVATVSDDPMDYEHVPELIATGVEKMREGVKLGMQMTSAGEVVANVLLTIRQNMIDPETGLPDLPWRMKATRNAASKVYSEALEGVADDDVEFRSAHASLQKATQNKASDVLVAWLRGYDRDNEESMALLAEMFPAAAEMVEADAELSPEDAIRSLYAQHDIELPVRGRTEQMRINRRVEKIKATAKELEAAQDANDKAKVEELKGAISDLKAELPEDALDALGAPTAEKSDAEKTTEALEKLKAALETAGKRAMLVKGGDKR